jgi:uncharacterized protein YaaQ
MDAIKRTTKLTGDLDKDRDAIRDTLKKTSIEMTQGKIEFDKTGQVYTVVPSPVQVQVVDGKPQLFVIYPLDRAGSAYQEPLPWDKRKS